MSNHFYSGNGSHMSAIMKNDLRELRKHKPELFIPTKVTHTEMDGDGKVTSTTMLEAKAVPMSPRQRHVLCTQRRSW